MNNLQGPQSYADMFQYMMSEMKKQTDEYFEVKKKEFDRYLESKTTENVICSTQENDMEKSIE